MVGSLAQVLQPNALEAGTLIIGIYDMDYYVHSSFQYHLQVRDPLLLAQHFGQPCTASSLDGPQKSGRK